MAYVHSHIICCIVYWIVLGIKVHTVCNVLSKISHADIFCQNENVVYGIWKYGCICATFIRHFNLNFFRRYCFNSISFPIYLVFSSFVSILRWCCFAYVRNNVISLVCFIHFLSFHFSFDLHVTNTYVRDRCLISMMPKTNKMTSEYSWLNFYE